LEREVKAITTTEMLEEFLKTYSKTYSNIIGASKLAAGGEAIVYRIEHTGLDEIVAKCPIFAPTFN